MNDKEVKKLYTALLGKGYSTNDLGDEDTFRTKMSDKESRKQLYDWVSSKGNFRLGDYDTYESRLTSSMAQDKEETKPVATPTEASESASVENPLSEQDKKRFNDGINQLMLRTKQSMNETNEQLSNLSEYREKEPLGGTTAEGTMQFNPESGKMEKTYLTPLGNRYTSKGLADMESFRYRQAADMSVNGQLRKANERLRDIDERLEARERVLLEEQERNKPKGFVGFLAEMGQTMAADRMGGASGMTPEDGFEFQTDKEYQSLRLAKRQLEEQIQQLENYSDKEKDGEQFLSDFGRNTWQKIADVDAWDFGKNAMRDALTMLELSNRVERGEELTEAENDALYEMFMHNNVMQQFGDLGKGAKWGDIAGGSLSFMKDFLLTGGGFSGLSTKVATKLPTTLATKAATRLGIDATESLGMKVAKEGLFSTIRHGGKGVAAKLLAEQGKWGTTKLVATRALGVTAEDLLIRAPLMTTTIQGQNTAAEIINTKLGPVIVDEETGELRFTDDNSWGEAAWEVGADKVIENFSEMWGAHLPGITDVTRAFGARNLTAALLRSTRPGAGTVLSKTSEFLGKVGINGYFGEVGEEYYGQLWRTMLNLDSSKDADGNNLFGSGEFHGDIWGGMAMSIGLTGGATMGVTYTGKGVGKAFDGAKYVHLKHQLSKSDARAAEIMTPEVWDGMRMIIDHSDNVDMCALATQTMNDKEITDEQRAAVMEYMERSMIMRGYNLGEFVRRKNGDIPSVEDDELDQCYIDGYNIGSAQEMHDTKNMYEYQRQRMVDVVGTDEETLNSNSVDWLNEYHVAVNSGNEERANVIFDYLSAARVWDGMIQRVRDDIDGRVAQSNAMVNVRTNKTTGMIQGATMKTDDRKVYVINGNLIQYADGSGIDGNASDGSVIVRDAETGTLEQVSPDAILNIDEALDPNSEKETAAEAIRQQFAQEAANKIDGVITFNPGDTYTITGDDAQIQVQIVANDEGIVDNGDGTVNVSDGTNVFPLAKETIQQQVEEANLARVAQFEQQRAIENAERQQAMQSQFAINDEVVLQGEDGEIINGVIADYNKDDDMFVLDVDKPINGKYAPQLTRADLERMLQQPSQKEHNGVAIEQPAENEGNNGAENIPENGNNTPQNIPAMQRIPKDMQGNPIYEQADSDTAWDAIVEQTEGDEVMAQTVADGMVADKEAALKKLEKTKSKGGVSIAEKIAAEKERKAAIDAAQQEVNIWKKIAGTANRRRMEAEAERRRIADEAAAIRKAEEEKLRAEREEAERIKREALNGVPDMVDDTPLDARARGYRRVNGHKVDRQEPIQAVQGKEVGIKFSDGVITNGRVALIDATQLQPSHIQGVRNPLHFIDEAQPKERNDEASVLAARKIAGNIRPEEITSSVTAYTGAPTVNVRGEAIQGNSRSDALRLMWESHQDQAAKYKQYLMEHAEEFGLREDDVSAMERPVLVNMVDVNDEEAINLGQFVAQDTESGGMERIKAKNVLQKMGDDMRSFANLLLKSSDEEISFAGLVDSNGVEVLKWMNQKGYITPTQYKSAFDGKGNLSAEAKNDLRNIMYQSIFKGGSTRLEEMFNAIPSKAQKAILATAFRDYDSPNAERMNEEIQNSIRAYYALSHDKAFMEAKDFKEARMAVESWKRQYQIDDVTGESYLPAENFSNFALLLATMYRGENQSIIQGTFNKMYDLIQGTQETTLFEQPDNTPRTLAQAIYETLNITYDGQLRSNVLAGDSSASQGWQQGSNGNAATGKRVENGERTADNTRGTESSSGQNQLVEKTAPVGIGEEGMPERIEVQEDDWTEEGKYGDTYKRTIIIDGIHHVTQVDEANKSGNYTGSYFILDGKRFAGIPEVLEYIDNNGAVEKAQEVLDSIKQARSEVDTNPTDAQKEAGNYKKGHIKIDGFDITIENPKGGVRSGTDKNGKKWSITMNNDYGYIRGTEAVDGDHIDVFLSSFPTQGNVFVVDQSNEDGSFDESKVMYGFSSLDEARAAYLSNYEEGWETRIMAITEVSKDEFKKWIDSSHRKTKAFSEYKTVKKAEEQNVADERNLKQQLSKFKVGDVVRDFYENKLYRIKKHSTNGVSIIAKLDEEGNEVSTTTINAHNNARYSLAEAPAKKESPTLSQESDQDNDQDNGQDNGSTYTIQPAQYTTKKGKVLDMHLVKFTGELRKGVAKNAYSYAKSLKGWWDREKNGFMMRSEEDAKQLAEYVADAQSQEPVSITDIKAVNDGDVLFTEPHQPKEVKDNAPVWQYSVLVDKKSGRTTLRRDDVSGIIPIGDARFTVTAESPQEMLDILRNPLNGMQEVLDAVGVTLENKIMTRAMDKKVNKSSVKRPQEGDIYKNNMAGGDAVALIRGVGKTEYVVAFASDLEDAQGGLFMGDKIVDFEEMDKWLADGSLTKIEKKKEYHGGERVFSLKHNTNKDILAAHHKGDKVEYVFTDGTTANSDEVHSALPLAEPKNEPKNDPKDEANSNGNRLVTDERYAELRERMRKKLGGQMNIGIDPEILAIGTEMAVYHLEKGARKFAEYAKAMIADLGDAIRPYLKAFYNGARELPEVVENGLSNEMTPYDEVQTFDVANFDKPVIDAFATAETVSKEADVEQEVNIAQERIKKSRSSSKKSEKKNVSSQKQEGGLFGDLFAESNKAETDMHRKFAMAVKADMLSALDNGTKPYRSILDLRKRASELGMEVDNEGRTDILLQELVEDGLVRAAREVVESKGRDSRESYDLICKLYEMQPTIAARSSNRIKMQQYSTPLPMAWIANRFAMAKNAGGRVLEPTAGNGMLVFTVPVSQVHANELDETRLDNLRDQGFAEVTQQDATEPFKGGMLYDAIIANPPFGKREAVEYDGKMIPGLDPQITLNALSSMKNEGRAAIIIGGNMEYSSNGAIKSMKPFFTYLYDHYNVKGVIDMSGGLYAKQGTTFPTRMILIDGRRSEEERAQTAVYPPVESKAIRKAESFEDLYEIINEVLNSKEKTNGTEILRSRQGQLVSVDNRPSGNTYGTGHREQPRKNDEVGKRGDRPEGNQDGGKQVLSREHRANHADGEARAEASSDNTGGSRSVSGLSVQRLGTDRVSTDGVGLKQTHSEPKKRTLTDEKSAYRPHNSAFSLNSVAPAAMVEAMDKVLSQIEEKHGNIDEFVRAELGYDTIEEAHQALAAEQMDSVAMAIYQMKQGQALIIGDQTGVGKGRQMAALIRWAVQRGEKPVFITQKADLFSDIYRDLVDVGSGDLIPFIFNSDGAMVDSKGNTVHKPLSSSEMAKVFASGSLPDKYDFAVLTYSQVNTGDAVSQKEMEESAKSNGERSKKGKNVKNGKPTPKATFLRAIAADNYLFLDESHTAAGSSNTGAYLQSILRTAKAATFASATFAKRPDTMPLYAIRTAMSQAKIEPNKMIGIIEKGGVTLQEIMSRELTNAGQMVRRERDMSDVVTDWKTITDPETVRRARENYDRTIAAFNAIIKFQEDYVKPMIEALDMELAVMAESAGVKRGTDKMGVENVPFASKTYNYTKQLMLALKVDAIADEVEAEIKAGRHPVIALESTMESSIKDYAAGEIIDEPTFSASLLRGLDTVMQYTVKDENGRERHERYSPQALGPVGEKAYYELQDFIRESTNDIFISPLDAIIERLHEKGYKVGELTGRNMYVERNEDGRVIVKRRTDKDKKKMQREFNNGTLDVLILNKSASTGISLHASEKFSDQRQRSMIIAQPLSDINDYMQMIGRIDRTGQVHRGYYINLGLPVPAENRFLMMLSTKLKSLNANTTTSQDSESNDVEAPDLLNKYGSQVVVEYLRDNLEVYEKMGTPLKKGGLGGGRLQASELEDYKAQEDDARKITGYVALLTTKEQEDFYDDVVRRYNELIKYLNDTGSNDLKITVMPLRAKTIEKRVSSEGIDPNGNNPFARNSYVEKVEMDVLRKPMKADEIRKVIEQISKGDATAYMKRVFDTVSMEDEARIAAENERYEKAKERAVEDIAKQTEKINGQKKRSDEEKRVAIENFKAETNEKVEAKHKDNMARIYANRDQMMHRLTMFESGKSYLVPENLYSLVFDFATPAIFCGYKTKESKITASTTLAVFATLDGRRRIEIKLSQIDALQSIERMTEDNWDAARSTTLDNWDSQIPSETRKTGFIMTGNILQAIADIQDERGSTPGQLISYTDMDGNIHDGILMPDKWNASMLKSGGAPLSSRLQQIKNYQTIKSHDGKVELTGSGWAKMYYLTVPKTKKDGAVYFENKSLLRAAGGNFYPYRGQLRADIPASQIDDVVKVLTQLGVKVKEENQDDVMFRTDTDYLGVLENAYKTNDKELIQDAVTSIRKALMNEENISIGDLNWEMLEDYNGNNPKLLAAQYIVRAEHDIYLDDDIDPEYMKTGIKSVEASEPSNDDMEEAAYTNSYWEKQIELSQEFKKNVKERQAYHEKGMWMWNGLMDEKQISSKYSSMKKEYEKLLEAKDYEKAADVLGELRAFHKGFRKYIKDSIVEIPDLIGLPEGIRFRKGKGALTEDEVSMANDPVGKIFGHSSRSERERKEFAVRERKRMVQRVKDLANKLGLDNVEIVTNANGLQGAKRKAKGYYSKSTGKITIVIPNHTSTFDAEQTLLHEAVAHYGLRKLFGEHFDTFLDNVFSHADESIRRRIVDMAAKNGWDFRKATEEYLATLAENTEFENVNTSWWGKIKELFLQMLHKIGFEDFGGVTLTDNELRYILWRSYENLAEPGKHRSILSEAADIAKQYELGVGNYSESEESVRIVAEGDSYSPDSVIRYFEEIVANHPGIYAVRTEEDIDALPIRDGLKSSIKEKIKDSRSSALNLIGKDMMILFVNHLDEAELRKTIPHELAHYASRNLNLDEFYKMAALDYVRKRYFDEYKHITLDYANEDWGEEAVAYLFEKKSEEIGFERLLNSKFDTHRDIGYIFYQITNYLNHGKRTGISGHRESLSGQPNTGAEGKGHGVPQKTGLFGKIGQRAEQSRNGFSSDGERRGTDKGIRPSSHTSVGNRLEGGSQTEEVEDDVLYRTGSSLRARYDRKVRMPNKSGSVKYRENLPYRLKEAYQDCMAALKVLQDIISEETGNEIHSYENAYMAENRMSSENKAQAEIYERDFYNPLRKAVQRLIKLGSEYEELKSYIIAKHGLERNRKMAEKAAGEAVAAGDVRPYAEILAECRARDYSGLTALTGMDNVADAEAEAQRMVDEYESHYDVSELWKKINAATKETLRKSYDSGLMNKATYEKVRDMYEYYVPLRGWDCEVASNEYEYMTSNQLMLSPALKVAEGRTSLADDPLATIGFMAESSIVQGNRNKMKQKFLNFILNNPTDLVTVSEQWYVLDATGVWKPRNPIIPENTTGDEVAAIVEQFEQEMEALGDKATKKRDGLKLDMHLTEREGQEHVVRVKRNGKEYCLYVNGSPRAAQAINGLTNPDASDKSLYKAAKAVKHWMASMFTSKNPAFIATNLSRDVIWAGTAVAIKEDAAYTARYTKNISECLLKAQLPRLLMKFKSGTLDMNDELERYFGEFIRNGGETGFTQLNTVEDYKRNIKRFVKEAQVKGSITKKAWNGLWDSVEFLNRSAEDTTRFMVYMTSRQMGRDMARSIYDAKEITVNFNKKGSGGLGANLMNFCYIFFNATIQGLANFGRLMAKHPLKTTMALTLFSSAGFLVPMLNLAIQAMLGGDDDENSYWDLPEWVRRNNIVLYVPWSDNGYITIPLPHEMRPFYGMGEIAYSCLMGKDNVDDGLKKAVAGFSALLPIDLTGNGGNIAVNMTPTIGQPFAQIIANTDYFGKPIYKRHEWNERYPEWTKAYKGTAPWLVDGTRWLNEITGGDNVESGDVDYNPALIEHLFESYLGGVGKTINKSQKTLEMLWNEDLREWRNVPVISSFYHTAEERTAGSQINREYYNAVDEMKDTQHLFSGYKAEVRMGNIEYAEKINELINSEVFKRYGLIKGYNNAVQKASDALKLIKDPARREEVETTIINLKVEMLEKLEKMEERK